MKKTQERLSGVEETAQAARKAVSGSVPGADRAAQEDLGMPNQDDGAQVKKGFWGNTELDKLWNTPIEELRG